MHDEAMKFGLLLESVQVQQKSLEEHLASLKAHTRDLDGVVRDEIRRTLLEELQLLDAETGRAVLALQRMGRAANVRATLWGLALATLATVIPGAALWWITPSTSELGALRSQRAELTRNLKELEKQGARIEWRHCGDSARLCLRIDRAAPSFGPEADFYVVKGY
jgi:hypothetical protein